MNRGFVKETGRACLLDIPNIDTDIIIPQSELTTTTRTGLSAGLFAHWRYTEGRTENPEFVLNRSANHASRFLIAARNFGCGSSREHAVWALADFGIRAVISSQFGEIFQTNCVRNGMLPATVSEEDYAQLAVLARCCNDGMDIGVDLQYCTITVDETKVPFQIDASDRERLLKGLDEVAETLIYLDTIKAFAVRDVESRPWLHQVPWTTL